MRVDLPYGKGFGDVVKRRDAIVSGLDVAISQVHLERDPTSNRRHRLWVADRDPLAVPAGRTPLLRGRATDIWAPAPFGLDERGRPVAVDLMWHSVMIGAVPRAGKSWSARVCPSGLPDCPWRAPPTAASPPGRPCPD